MGYGVVIIPSTRRRRRIDVREVADLIISWAVLTVAFGAPAVLYGDLRVLGVAAVAVATAFIAHELSHRQVARRYGLYARYRAWYAGLVIAIVAAILSTKILGRTFVFAAPGAVYVAALYPARNPRAEVRVAEAGPLANLGLAAALLLIAPHFPPPWSQYAEWVGSVNSWIAFFNLLPIPPLDGFKIIRGALPEWVVLFGAALLLYFIG